MGLAQDDKNGGSFVWRLAHAHLNLMPLGFRRDDGMEARDDRVEGAVPSVESAGSVCSVIQTRPSHAFFVLQYANHCIELRGQPGR